MICSLWFKKNSEAWSFYTGTQYKNIQSSHSKTKEDEEVEVWNRIEEGLLDIHVHSDSVFDLL